MVTNITSVEQLDFLDVHKNDGDIYSVFFQIKEGKVIEPETREKVPAVPRVNACHRLQAPCT